jgi:quercetin dioxygenase-like cupin family protein
MKALAGLLSALNVLVALPALAQRVEPHGIGAQVKIEEKVYGQLEELNGKYKLRATELTFAPGAKLGPHHHAGPGLRYVAVGEVTFVEGGKANVYKAGDYFYESGDIVHAAENRTPGPLRIIFFEVLPADRSGGSVIAPKPH